MVIQFTAEFWRYAERVFLVFARSKARTRYRRDTEVHHVVAKMARNAKYARKILDLVHIGYNSKINLIRIKTGLHRRLHTNQYYGWANSVVISAFNVANGNSFRAWDNVVKAIEKIRQYISYLNTSIAPY